MWCRYFIWGVAQTSVCEALRPTGGCRSIDLLLFSCTCRLSNGGKICWVETVGQEPYFKCLKVGGIKSLSSCQAARCGAGLGGQLNKSDKKSANTERDANRDGRHNQASWSNLRTLSKQTKASHDHRLFFFLTYQFKPLGCSRKWNGPERGQDLKCRGKLDAHGSLSFSSSGSAALFLAAEAEMESDCRHRLMAVFLIKKKPPPGV